MDSLPFGPSGSIPEEFRFLPDLSALRWKLFVLNTRDSGQSSAPTQRRRRREGTDTSTGMERQEEEYTEDKRERDQKEREHKSQKLGEKERERHY